MQRFGGRGGLSLESFANAKTRNENYNPSLINFWGSGRLLSALPGSASVSIYSVVCGFRREVKCYGGWFNVWKFKRSLKQQEQLNIHSTDERPLEGDNETNEEGDYVNQNKKGKKNAGSLGELYEKKRDEEEKARMERGSMIQAKKEEIQKAEARRRALKEKIFKKSKSGQPVMKYIIEHLLETIQGPTN